MGETKQTNVRLNALSQAQLKELSDKYGMTVTDLIVVAIDRMYQEEKPRLEKTLPPK